MPRQKWTDEERQASSAYMKSVWADPELRAKRTAGNKRGAKERIDRLKTLDRMTKRNV